MKLYYHSFLDIVSMFHSCKMQCQLHANVFFFCRGGVLSVWMTEVLNQTPVLFNVNGNTIIDTNLLFLFNKSNFRNKYKNNCWNQRQNVVKKILICVKFLLFMENILKRWLIKGRHIKYWFSINKLKCKVHIFTSFFLKGRIKLWTLTF